LWRWSDGEHGVAASRVGGVCELWRGLALLRSLCGGGRVVGLVLLAVLAQIPRNWMLLHAVASERRASTRSRC
jgi:hypothetical protein